MSGLDLMKTIINMFFGLGKNIFTLRSLKTWSDLITLTTFSAWILLSRGFEGVHLFSGSL